MKRFQLLRNSFLPVRSNYKLQTSTHKANLWFNLHANCQPSFIDRQFKNSRYIYVVDWKVVDNSYDTQTDWTLRNFVEWSCKLAIILCC